jgi:hypothetical protein
MAVTALRKTIDLEVLGETITVDVDFRLIEVMERAFNTSADLLVPRFLNIESLQRRLVADVIADLLVRKGELRFKREQVREYVITAEPDGYTLLATQLLIALMFTIRMIDGQKFDAAASTVAANIADGKKKALSPAADTSPPATT